MSLFTQAARLTASATALFGATAWSLATTTDPYVHVPATSDPSAAIVGRTAHTNHLVYTGPTFRPDDPVLLAMEPSHGPSLFRMFTGPSGYNPTQIRSAYGDDLNGGGAIAIVDAYDFPTALNDFDVFSNQFGLPSELSKSATLSSNPVFQVVYATGSKPAGNGGWNEEEALDIEWAHAMAPGAKIYLVEAASAGFGDLTYAVSVASKLPGVKQVSMSWGGAEYSYESLYDSYFTQTGVTYFASSGDTGAVPEWPAMSPNVVQVGGTTLKLSSGQYLSESAWSSTGGGTSSYESLPTFQKGLGFSKRSGPDVSAVGDPNTGVAVYDSTKYENYVGWLVFGGTSVAAPVVAGLTNASQSSRGAGETGWIYGNSSLFHDVTTGGTGATTKNGKTTFKFPAKVGFDLATGWGSPKSTGSL